MSDKLDNILYARNGAHGEFTENSRATWEIMRALANERNWATLPDHMKHAAYMISHKLARIMAGDPTVADHWDDIAGYASLVSRRLETPVAPIDKFDDPYHALSIAWNCSRDEAKNRLHATLYQRRQAASSPVTVTQEINVPGTPEDGGHHAAESDMDNAVSEELRSILKNGAGAK